MNILCYGDSNTWGYDPRDPLCGRYDNPWPELLAKMTGWNVCNQGLNGREVPVGPVSFPNDSTRIIVMLGTNDLLHAQSPETVCGKTEQFLCSLDTERKNILLVAPPPMVFGEWVPDQELIDRSVSLTNGYQTLAQRLGVGFADAGEWNVHLAFDGVHFTQEGHIAFAEGLSDYLKKEQPQ